MTIEATLEAAIAHHQAGRLAEAEAGYRQILALAPQHPHALQLLGLVALQSGHPQAALELIQHAIALRPDAPEYHANLGHVLEKLERLPDALQAFERSLALAPQNHDLRHHFGVRLGRLGYLPRAIEELSRVAAAQPDNAQVRAALGYALQHSGRLEEAVEVCRRATQLAPNFMEGHCNLGAACFALGRADEAAAAFERARQLAPRNATVLSGLAGVWLVRGNLDRTIELCRTALHEEPQNVNALSNLANALKDRGEAEHAVVEFRRALSIAPDHLAARDNLIVTLHYRAGTTRAELAAEHHAWSERHEAPLRALRRPHANARDPDRRLRVGYVSADFRSHPAARFLLPLLCHHDRTQFDLVAYANVVVPDAVTREFQALVPTWRAINATFDPQVAEQIRADGIDILVDLSAHTLGNRLRVFGYQPAPVQATWLAYAGGTQLESMDYRLTDPHLEPPGAESDGKALRLAETFWCYEPPAFEPVIPPPFAPEGTCVFGCLNNFAKVTPLILELWGRLLHETAGTHLVVHVPEGSARARVRDILVAQGVDPARVTMVGRQEVAEYLGTFRRIDVALDAYPFGGGTTTCDALWMGTPVVTLSGPLPVARAGASLLSNAGLPELVAQTPDAYIAIARALAQNRERRAELRATLRTRFERSVLMDGPRFARNVEAAYRTMWRRWCESPAP